MNKWRARRCLCVCTKCLWIRQERWAVSCLKWVMQRHVSDGSEAILNGWLQRGCAVRLTNSPSQWKTAFCLRTTKVNHCNHGCCWLTHGSALYITTLWWWGLFQCTVDLISNGIHGDFLVLLLYAAFLPLWRLCSPHLLPFLCHSPALFCLSSFFLSSSYIPLNLQR